MRTSTTLITKLTTFLRQQLVLILLQQRYNLTRLRFANQSAQGLYVTTENLRSMQQFPWQFHRRQCHDIYDCPGSYGNQELSGNDQNQLNSSLQQPQTGGNGINTHFSDRPCS